MLLNLEGELIDFHKRYNDLESEQSMKVWADVTFIRVMLPWGFKFS